MMVLTSIGRCAFRTVIGFMGTKVVDQCGNQAVTGGSFCREHALWTRARIPHNSWLDGVWDVRERKEHLR